MSKLLEDLWAPLYNRVLVHDFLNYSDLGLFFMLENPEAINMYRRAQQRWYGDSRPDHIKW